MEKLLTAILNKLRTVKTKISFPIGAYELDGKYCVVSWFFGTSSPTGIHKLSVKKYGATFDEIEAFVFRMDELTKGKTMNKWATDRYISREVEFLKKGTTR